MNKNRNTGYIVNHTLKQICGPYKDIGNALKQISKVRTLKGKETLTDTLVEHKDSCVISHDIPEYMHLSKTGKATVRPYKTDTVHVILQSCGVYCIINAELNQIYIGETITSFDKRWIQHYKRPGSKKLNVLIHHPATTFKVLQITPRDKEYTEERELHYIDYFKQKTDYDVYGGNFTENKKN